MKNVQCFDSKRASILFRLSNTPKLQHSEIENDTRPSFLETSRFLSTLSSCYFLGSSKTNGIPTRPMAALIR